MSLLVNSSGFGPQENSQLQNKKKAPDQVNNIQVTEKPATVSTDSSIKINVPTGKPATENGVAVAQNPNTMVFLNSHPLDKIRNSKAEENLMLQSGDKGTSIQQLHILLRKLGLGDFDPNKNTFDEKTEAAVKKFQKDNNLPETGTVDKITLITLERADKEDENDIYINKTDKAEPPPRNDFERVRQIVSSQLEEKGVDTEKAFATGEDLVKSGKKYDRLMSSSSKCYTAVKRAIEDSMNIPYQVFTGRQYPQGKYARTAGDYLLSKQSEFVKIEGLQRTDLDNLPPGAIIVYKPQNRSAAGHIGIQDGKGKDISDVTRVQRNVHKTAAFEVYFPVTART